MAEAIALFDDIDELGDDKKAEITTEGDIQVARVAGIYDNVPKRYGVSGIGGSNTTLTRLWNSVGLTAAAGTDTLAPVNDFDNIAPFNRRKCVGSWTFSIPATAPELKFIVKSYYGDPDYVEDGSMGDYVQLKLILYIIMDDFHSIIQNKYKNNWSIGNTNTGMARILFALMLMAQLNKKHICHVMRLH